MQDKAPPNAEVALVDSQSTPECFKSHPEQQKMFS